MANSRLTEGTTEDKSNESTYLIPQSPVQNEKRRRLPRTSRMSRGRTYLVMAACMSLQATSSGIGFGLGIMYPELIRVFNTTSTEAALVQSIFFGIATGSGIIWSWLMKRYGTGYFVIIGGFLACTGLIISSLASNVLTIIIGTGVITGTGMSICYLAPFIVITILIKDNTSVYLVFLATGSSVGQFIMPYVFEICLTRYNWSGTFLIIAGVGLQCVAFGTFLQCALNVDGETSKKTQECSDTKNLSNGKGPTVQKGNVYKLILTDIVVLMLLVNYFLMSISGNLEAWFITDMLVSRGYARKAGSDIVSMIGVSNICARIIAGLVKLKCKWPTAYHWIYITPIAALGHGLVVYFTDYTAIFITCVIYTLFYGTTIAHGPALMLEAVDFEKFPVAMAMVNVTYGVGNFLGGLMGGATKEAYGSYNLLFYIGVACCLYICLTTLTVVFIMRHRQRRSGYEKFESDVEIDNDAFDMKNSSRTLK